MCRVRQSHLILQDFLESPVAACASRMRDQVLSYILHFTFMERIGEERFRTEYQHRHPEFIWSSFHRENNYYCCCFHPN